MAMIVHSRKERNPHEGSEAALPAWDPFLWDRSLRPEAFTVWKTAEKKNAKC